MYIILIFLYFVIFDTIIKRYIHNCNNRWVCSRDTNQRLAHLVMREIVLKIHIQKVNLG